MSKVERFKYLLNLYQDNNISVVEHDELFEMIATSSYDQLIEEEILNDLQHGQGEEVSDLSEEVASEIVRKIFDVTQSDVKISA